MIKLVRKSTDRWNDRNWKYIQSKVFKMQKEIYIASKQNNMQRVRKYQRLLMKSFIAKCLAIRKITQDNQGKKTAGIDGIKQLSPIERLNLAKTMKIGKKASPLRRIWIPKPNNNFRPLGIPTIHDRCIQALVKLALEPEWEAKFEPNSYGFRPGKSAHDAISAIRNCIQKRAKYVLDANITKCFDQIDHDKLLNKLQIEGKLRSQIKSWLKAGVLENAYLTPSISGTPQGSVISHLLANIALHGLETQLKYCFKDIPIYRYSGKQVPASRVHETLHVIRYADDFVVLHDNLEVILRCKNETQKFLNEIGLELSEEKTRITHTLEIEKKEANRVQFDGKIGFEFLGFQIKQFKTVHQSDYSTTGTKLGYCTRIYPSAKAVRNHQKKLHQIILIEGKKLTQFTLIEKLNPIIRGWASYYGVGNAATMGHLANYDHLIYLKLRQWAKRIKGRSSKIKSYWNRKGSRKWVFGKPEGISLHAYADFSLPFGKKGYVKVKSDLSPFDGNTHYWTQRLITNPKLRKLTKYLLASQKGKWAWCKKTFQEEDVMEIDHIIPTKQAENNSWENVQLLHRHCHQKKTTQDNGNNESNLDDYRGAR